MGYEPHVSAQESKTDEGDRGTLPSAICQRYCRSVIITITCLALRRASVSPQPGRPAAGHGVSRGFHAECASGAAPSLCRCQFEAFRTGYNAVPNTAQGNSDPRRFADRARMLHCRSCGTMHALRRLSLQTPLQQTSEKTSFILLFPSF